MISDIIGLKAKIKSQYDEAVELADAAEIARAEAVSNRDRLAEFLDLIEGFRGDRKNASRVYNAPGSGSKAAEIEEVVTAVLKAAGKLLKSDEILAAFSSCQLDLLPGQARTDKLARLSVYLTRMHRREGAPLAYDRVERVYSLMEPE